MTATEAWSCPTCKTLVPSPFCPVCGERPLEARDLTLRGFLEHVFEAFTSIDGRLVRTFRELLSRPGALTTAYLQGRRQPYIGPVTLFLIANVAFFAMESLTGGTIFTAPLQSHLHTQPWSEFAQRLVSQRLDATHTSLALYAPVFDEAIALKARSLIIFMALAFALVTAAVFFRRRVPLISHAVFALHFYAIVLLLLCVGTVVPVVAAWFGGTGQTRNVGDYVVSLTSLLLCAVYLYFAIGAVYRARGVGRVLETLGLTLAVAAIVLGYRFVLLLITLYMA